MTIAFEVVQLIPLLILGCMAGLFMKLADDISDKILRLNRRFAVPLGIAYGLLMGYLMIADVDASVLFGGIIIGCLVSGKIDSSGHYIGLATILAIVFSYGIKFSHIIFIIAAFAALDEMKEMIHISIPNFVFEYRLFLKIGVLLLVVFDFMGFNGLLLLFAFDFTYIITDRLNSR